MKAEIKSGDVMLDERSGVGMIVRPAMGIKAKRAASLPDINAVNESLTF
jgi:hypothetical protein